MNRGNANTTYDRESIIRRASSMSQIPRPSNFGVFGALPRPQPQTNNYLDDSAIGGRQYGSSQQYPSSRRLLGDSTAGSIEPRVLRFDEAVSTGVNSSQLSLGRPTNSIANSNYQQDLRQSSNFFAQQHIVALGTDPRQWKDKTYKNHVAKELYKFLNDNGFIWENEKRPFSEESLRYGFGPHLHLYVKIFEFIMSIILPNFTFSTNSVEVKGAKSSFGGKEMVVELDKQVNFWASSLGYPFKSDLKKSILSSPHVGSNWNIAVGFLDWLKEEALLYMAMTKNTAESLLSRAFFKQSDEMELDVTSAFHQLRFGLLEQIYMRKKEGNEEVQDLYEAFELQLRECVGASNDAENIRELEEQLLARRNDLDQRMKEYIPPEVIKAELASVNEEIASTNRMIEDFRKVIADEERHIVSNDQLMKQLEDENRELEKQAEEMQRKVNEQPMRKDKRQQLLREKEEIERNTAKKRLETAEYVKKIEAEQVKRSSLLAKLRELTKELRGLMADTRIDGGENSALPDYSEDADMSKYIDLLRSRIDERIREMRVRVAQAEVECAADEKEIKELTKKRDEGILQGKNLLNVEQELLAVLTAMEKEQPESIRPALLEKLESGKENLRALKAERDKLKLDIDEMEKKLEKKAKGVAMNIKISAENNAAMKIMTENYCKAHQERLEQLELYKQQLDAVLNKLIKTVGKVEQSSLATLTSRPASPPSTIGG